MCGSLNLSLFLTASTFWMYLYPLESAPSVHERRGWITFLFCWPGYVSRCSGFLRDGRFGNRIPVGAKFSGSVQTSRGAHPASYTMVAVCLSLGLRQPSPGAEHTPHLASRYSVWDLHSSGMLHSLDWLVVVERWIFGAEGHWGVPNSRESLCLFCLNYRGFLSYFIRFIPGNNQGHSFQLQPLL